MFVSRTPQGCYPSRYVRSTYHLSLSNTDFFSQQRYGEMLRITKVFRYHRVLKRGGIGHQARDLIKPSTGQVVVTSAELDNTVSELHAIAVEAAQAQSTADAAAAGASTSSAPAPGASASAASASGASRSVASASSTTRLSAEGQAPSVASCGVPDTPPHVSASNSVPVAPKGAVLSILYPLCTVY